LLQEFNTVFDAFIFCVKGFMCISFVL
jgi:hypothetical protein